MDKWRDIHTFYPGDTNCEETTTNVHIHTILFKQVAEKFAGSMQGTTRHCYILNIYAESLMVSEEILSCSFFITSLWKSLIPATGLVCTPQA